MEFISENLKIILLAIIAIFAGIALTFKIRKKGNTNKVKQKNNFSGGDMAGRDINKKP